jgi:NTE family protein
MPPFTATQNQLLTEHLRNFLPGIEPEALELLRAQLEWVEVPGGSTLMTQGEPGESMYLTVSGRLRAYVRSDDGHSGTQRRVADMGRGQVIGEISLFTDAPRAATVVAVRDSVLVRLTKDVFKTLLASSAQVSIALTRQIIQRLQSGTAAHTAAQERPVAMGLLPVSSGVDLQAFGQRLARHLGTVGRVRVVDSTTVDAELHEPGIAQREGADATANRRIAMLLDEIEARNDFVLLLADPEPTPWTRRVSRHCDELLLLADAQAEPAIHPIEENCLLRRAPWPRPPRFWCCCTRKAPSARAAPSNGWTAAPWPTTCTCALPSTATWRAWPASRAARPWAWCWPVAARAGLRTWASTARCRKKAWRSTAWAAPVSGQ